MDAQKKRAVSLTRQGRTKAAIARELGVDRSTITRWFQSTEFQEALAATPSEPELASQAKSGLAELIPEALALLARGMTDGDVSAAKMNSALAIIRTAATLSGADAIGEQGLATRLMELDKRGIESD